MVIWGNVIKAMFVVKYVSEDKYFFFFFVSKQVYVSRKFEQLLAFQRKKLDFLNVDIFQKASMHQYKCVLIQNWKACLDKNDMKVGDMKNYDRLFEECFGELKNWRPCDKMQRD